MGDINKTENFEKRKINIKRRLQNDTISAICSGLLVTPMLTPVDVAVVQAQSGAAKIFPAFLGQLRKMFLTPHKYVIDKPFLWVFGVYGPTYIMNNTIDSLCKIYNIDDVIPKLTGITAVNMTMSILKDAALAKYFGTKAVGRVPLNSYIIWLIRDILAMASAFIIPQRLAKVIERRQKLPYEKSFQIAQVSLPIVLQTVFLPIHLAGLDTYNHITSKFNDRVKRIFKVYPGALPLRCWRMGSAYGIGVVNNRKFRNYFNTKAEGKDWDKNY
jgi:hypothetical protein